MNSVELNTCMAPPQSSVALLVLPVKSVSVILAIPDLFESIAPPLTFARLFVNLVLCVEILT